MSGIAVGLSTASVHPEKLEDAFRYAAEVGYDGVELMVWHETASQDIANVAGLSMRYDMPVLSVHAPCLLISQRVWGSDPLVKLGRAVTAAEDLGADTVVVHPPFRWQRRYAENFVDLVSELEDGSNVAVAVENMFPLRFDVLRRGESVERLKRRGNPGTAVSAFAPSIDPTDVGYTNYTLDLSHTATAGVDALALMDRMGEGLRHLHLTDGLGAAVDEHLVPGHGTQPAAEVCRRLAASGFDGHVILEIATGSAKTTGERRAMLTEALEFAREHLRVAPAA
ncbi:sugar phosphate isomerase/epimerase family protein [Tsukamurella spumae]|uniref:Sugar phosphate isomerase/epimerase n=1 Tax=Tsukamurella spumae TaxID=44753 RepID=A0A846WWH5_9ACTN|nr:sugar phosphate isomerase/epimerase [Tsukamurella spumae]NKY17204.1 sugar phosphate isomerase/epimerase [Tsukamurella spumae]